MEFIFEIVLQFLGEMLVQLVFEFLVEFGAHKVAPKAKRPPNAVLSAIGFVIWGAMAGGVSLLLFPNSAIHNPVFRKINLVVTPLAAGGIMMLIGRLRDKKGQALVRLDRFGFAFVFALSMAVVRYLWAV